ncbi:hypothetical protein C8R44DRAFT_747819 [Mycena epipterygia]|nr:hypothetical protein C8R44DRAFT_747819 [Mycena epipterygia]
MSKILPKHSPDMGVRVLSLDGGGAGALSELLILEKLMYRIKIEGDLDTIPSPCECFELIGGTGTGGIVALMLGPLQMSTAGAISAYQTLCPQSKMGSAEQFRTSKFEDALKRIFKQKKMDNLNTDVCKTFVCAMSEHNMNAGIPHLFRSYNTLEEPASNCMIWQAARATSATPRLFKPMEIGLAGLKQRYIDGCVGNNNPTSLVVEEAKQLYPSHPIVLVTSLGAGHPDTVQIPKTWSLNSIAQVMKNIATDCEKTHEDNVHKFQTMATAYFRFNVQQGMQALEPKDWNKLPEVLAHTNSYLKTHDAKSKLTEVVKIILNPAIPVSPVSNPETVSVLKPTNNCAPPSRIFQGRQTILHQMHTFFTQMVGKQYIFVLHGLGGAGKTQIALKFIKKSASNFTDIFFIDSSSVDTIDVGLKNIATTKSVGESAQDALQWLQSKQEQWLLFFDNADDPTINLSKYVPQCDHGNILITSRNPELRVYAGSHSLVSDMEEKDAVDLLLRSAVQETTEINRTTAGQIVKVLHYLPLAIIQAGAFIAKSEDLDHYLAIYEQNRAQLLSQKPTQSHDNYAWTVYTTWQISFDRLSPPAATFLQLCSLLHHQRISEQIFKNAATYKFGPSSPSKEELQMPLEFLSQFLRPDGGWDSICFMDITKEVRAYSLLTFHPQQKMFSMHPLVHDWTRSTLSDEESYHHCMVAIVGMSVGGLVRKDVELASLWMLPHIDSLMRDNSNVIPDFRHEFGKIYVWGEKLDKGEELQVAVFQKRRNVLGENHQDTLEAMFWLAWISRQLGKFKKAEKLEVVVLKQRMDILGDNHLDTLAVMGNLAATYHQLGKLKEAEELEVVVLAKRRQILGENHPDTLLTMANLAASYHMLGRLEKAMELGIIVLEKRRNVLGDNHPDTLNVMGNLSLTYKHLGRLKEAEELEVAALEKWRNILSDNHPDTWIIMGNLAGTYRKLGKLKEAEGLEVMVLKKRRHILGENHPNTLTAMGNLACTYRVLGKFQEAEELEVVVLEKMKNVLGDNHQKTLRAMGNLATTYNKLERWQEAKELGVTALKKQMDLLGDKHPQTLETMQNLAVTYEQLGKSSKAEGLNVIFRGSRA